MVSYCAIELAGLILVGLGYGLLADGAKADNTRHNDNVIFTSKRRRDFDAIVTLSFRKVCTGKL